MFNKCDNITEIILCYCNSSQVKDINDMFKNYSTLASKDLFNFNISQVLDMNRMFYHCSLLTSLDSTNFNTSQVKKNDLYIF